MDSSRIEIEKIIEKIRTIETTYGSLLSKTVDSDDESASDNSDSAAIDDFAAVRKEIEELKAMLNNDKI